MKKNRCKQHMWLLQSDATSMSMSTITMAPDKMDTVCVMTDHQLSTKSDLIKYLHLCACSPPSSTWINAIDKGFSSIGQD